MSAQPIIDQFRDLSAEEKLVLIDQLWTEFADSANDLPLLEWQSEVLEGRLRDAKANPDDVEDWNDVQLAGRKKLVRSK